MDDDFPGKPAMTAPLPEDIEFADAAAGLDVPPSLQASIDRHRRHLIQLAARLRAAGVPGSQIEASVNTLIASYRAELITVLKSLAGGEDDAA